MTTDVKLFFLATLGNPNVESFMKFSLGLRRVNKARNFIPANTSHIEPD